MDNVTLLDWDSKFFGFPVAQISSNRLDKKSLQEVLYFCRKNKIKLLQFKCDAHHRQSILLAEKNNFHFADVRITLTKQLCMEDCHEENLPEKISLRLAEDADILSLKEIVTDIYTNSRYYFDTNFPIDFSCHLGDNFAIQDVQKSPRDRSKVDCSWIFITFGHIYKDFPSFSPITSPDRFCIDLFTICLGFRMDFQATEP